MTIGTFVSSLLVGPLSSKFGRKHGLWAAATLNAISTAIMLGTKSVAALYVARLILGMRSSILMACRVPLIMDSRCIRRLVLDLFPVVCSRGSASSPSWCCLCFLPNNAVRRFDRRR